MNVTRDDIISFSKKLININKPPILWHSIRIDGNCFFHALEYAAYQRLLSKTSPKTIEFRQNIVSTMNKKIIAGVPYEKFMHGPKWEYVEFDVIIAAAKYIKKTIIIISLGEHGGVTMIRPKNLDLDPVFLICQHAIHYVPFHSDKGIKISKQMKEQLKGFEKTKLVENEDGAVITSFLLSDITNSTNNTRKVHVNSLLLAKKRYKSAKRLKQENENYSYAKRLQKQIQENANYSYAKRLQNAEYRL